MTADAVAGEAAATAAATRTTDAGLFADASSVTITLRDAAMSRPGRCEALRFFCDSGAIWAGAKAAA